LKQDHQQGIEGGLRLGIPLWLGALAALLFAGVAGIYAFCHIFSRFAPYDDEGFFMITLRGYLEGHPLYDSVMTVYGPFYYLYEGVIHAFAWVPVTHDSTRILCIAHWLVASAVLAWASGLMTRSAPLAFFVFMQGVVHLKDLAYEPSHPQEVVVVLLALSVLVVAREGKRPWMLPLLGGICAACVLTKINVGVFFGLALLMALAGHASFFQTRRVWFGVLVAFTALLPFVLMRPRLGEGWAREYAAQMCGAILASGTIAYVFAGKERMGLRPWLQAGVGFGAVCGVVLGVVLLQGSTAWALLDSLLLVPAKFGSTYCVPLKCHAYLWSGGAALCLATIFVCRAESLGRLRFALAFFKGVYGVLGTLVLVTDSEAQLCFLLPWAWLAMIPNQPDKVPAADNAFGRALVCLMAVWQSLQIYPVAGTQVVIGTFLPILIFSLCLHDTVAALLRQPWPSRWMRSLSPRTSLLLGVLVLTGLLYLFVIKWCTPLAHWRFYATAPSLGLPGARYVRLGKFQSHYYRNIAEYLRNECDTFVVIPGLNSMYFWTGKKPPTYATVSGESIFPSEPRQVQMLDAMRQAKRPVVLITEQSLREAVGSGALAHSPLGCFLKGECQDVGGVMNFRVLAPLKSVNQSAATEIATRQGTQAGLHGVLASQRMPAKGL
jgi:hypothetical protein